MSWTFHPPPGWPVPSGDWVPPPGWTPDPDWPPAPPGWEFWVYVDAPPAPSHPPLPARGRRGPAIVTAALAGIVVLATSIGGLVAYISHDGGLVTYVSQDDGLPEGPRVLYSGESPVDAAAAAQMGGDPVVVLQVTEDRATMVRVVDLATGRSLRALAAAPGGTLTTGEVSGRPIAVIAGADPPTMQVRDLVTGEQLHELVGHTDAISSVAVGELAGTPIAVSTSTRDRTVRIWDLTTGEQLHELYGEGYNRVDSEGLAVAEFGDRTLVAVSTIRPVSVDWYGLDVWSITAGAEPEHEQQLTCPDLWANGSRSAVAIGIRGSTPVAVSGCDRVAMWDITTGREIAHLDKDFGEPEAIALTEVPGAPVAVIETADGSILAWDLAKPDRVHTQFTGPSGPVHLLAVTELHGETVVVSGDTHGRVHVWPLTRPTAP